MEWYLSYQTFCVVFCVVLQLHCLIHGVFSPGPNASIHSLRAAVLPPAGAAEEQNRQVRQDFIWQHCFPSFKL